MAYHAISIVQLETTMLLSQMERREYFTEFVLVIPRSSIIESNLRNTRRLHLAARVRVFLSELGQLSWLDFRVTGYVYHIVIRACACL